MKKFCGKSETSMENSNLPRKIQKFRRSWSKFCGKSKSSTENRKVLRNFRIFRGRFRFSAEDRKLLWKKRKLLRTAGAAKDYTGAKTSGPEHTEQMCAQYDCGQIGTRLARPHFVDRPGFGKLELLAVLYHAREERCGGRVVDDFQSPKSSTLFPQRRSLSDNFCP
jgi:hypothetical protein